MSFFGITVLRPFANVMKRSLKIQRLSLLKEKKDRLKTLGRNPILSSFVFVEKSRVRFLLVSFYKGHPAIAIVHLLLLVLVFVVLLVLVALVLLVLVLVALILLVLVLVLPSLKLCLGF